MKFPTISLLVTTILWGILLGGVVYSHLVFFPVYLSDLPRSAAITNGTYAIKEEVFWLMIHPLLIIGLITSLIANWKLRARRKLILIPFIVYVLGLVITAIYFVPELIKFQSSPTSGIPDSEWASRAASWMRYSIIRGFTLLLAAIPLFIALTKPEKRVTY